jgi:ATP-dependent exoDNAse (exonuclease V) beta subunit
MIRALQQEKEDNRLFLVGDMKQAIYGFRGGNVGLIRRVDQEVFAIDPNKRKATLMVSRRSKREIVDFVNHFFRLALKPGIRERAYQADYIPLEALTETKTENNTENITETKTKFLTESQTDSDTPAVITKGSVRVWKFLPVDKTMPGAETVEDPLGERARLLPFVEQGPAVMDANYIASFLSDLKEDTEGLRYPEYADIGDLLRRDKLAVGILVRTQANVDQLTLALRLFGLKAGVRVGSQFFQRQEISDLYYLLRFLYDAWDDMALVAVLRSPLFGLSDAGLAAIANHRWQHRDRGAWWNTLPHPELEANLLPPDRSVLRIALHYLKLWRNRVRSHRVATLLEMALADTPFIVGQNDPAMAKANAYKLIALIRGLEQEGRSGLMAILGWINEQLEATGDADAVLPGTGSIEITTMHRSKGLQYPMVILSHLSADGRGNTGLYRTPLDLHSDGWPFFAYEVAESEDGEALGKQATFLKEALKYVNRVRDEAELMRLFYVACTRAESHLILSDTQELKKGAGKSSLIVKTLERYRPELMQARHLEVTKVTEADYRRLLDQLMAKIKQGQIKLDTLPADLPKPAYQEVLEPLLTPARAGVRLPSKSEDASVFIGSLPSPWKVLKPEDAGTLIHALLTYKEDANVPLERRFYQALARMDLDPRDPELANDAHLVLQHVARARRLLRERFPSVKQQFHEHPFEVYVDPSASVGSGGSASSSPYWLRGSIDLLIQTEDLTWHIVDVKTARLQRDEVEPYLQAHQYREQLAYYREAMAVASAQKIVVKPEHAVLLFTGVDEGLIL